MVYQTMRLPKILGILKGFKGFCQRFGWKTSENEDWIRINETYHNFVYARDIHTSSFKKIVASHKCVVPEGLSYRVVNASYMAWLFSETPSASVVETVCKDPEFSRKVAVYDLSLLLEGKNLCMKLNNTDSPAFQEFENFLRDDLKVKFKTLRTPAKSMNNVTIAELA